MRPRRVGTFLMSRRPTSAKLSARSRIASISLAFEVLDRKQVLHATTSAVWGSEIVTWSIPSLSSSRTLTRSRAGRGQVLADVVGPDRQLAVAAVAEHGELHAARAAVVEEGVDRGAHGAAGEEDVVDEDDGALAGVELDVGGVDDRLAGGVLGADVVAVEADVEVADRQLGAGQLGEEVVEATGEDRAASVDADDRESLGLGVLLGDLMGDPSQGSPQVIVLEHDLLTHSSLPSWPRGTWLKDGRSVAAPLDVPAGT